jgi:copper chaperone
MSQDIILKIEGMSCNHCKMAVEKALKAVPGVTSAIVDLAAKQAAVTGSAKRDELVKAIEDVDFTVVQ